MELMEHQIKAIKQMHDGCVLYGGVGSGKTYTALNYYIKEHSNRDLIVITTAKKRDGLDWEGEAARLGIGATRDSSVAGDLVVDSWNNAHKYVNAENAFFIFDEQRVVGTGAWVKAFIRIAKKNPWILLSATPGDTWLDYAPIFIANGYYKNITHFKAEHVVYAPYVKFPKVLRYINEEKLEYLRNIVLVEMPYVKHTTRILNYLISGYDHEKWNKALKQRWNMFEERPIKDVAELFRVMRRIVNDDPSKLDLVRNLMKVHPKLIVFYNFNYELARLRTLCDQVTVAEWNGHKKEPIPDTDTWVYLVQYTAGAEGWNCIETDAMILYSLTYSYKNFMQAQGRIDRLDTTFGHLYYYILVTSAGIDVSIRKALEKKKDFNVRSAAKGLEWPNTAV